jgi:hypothetical protein
MRGGPVTMPPTVTRTAAPESSRALRTTVPRDPYLGVATAHSTSGLRRALERPVVVADQVVARQCRGTDRGLLTRVESGLRTRGLVDAADLPLHTGDGGQGDDAGALDERRLVGTRGQVDLDLAVADETQDLGRKRETGLVIRRAVEDGLEGRPTWPNRPWWSRSSAGPWA